jgi:flagellar hook-length control protein FliK
MFQTPPADAGLGKLGLEPSGNSRKGRGGDEESFSQEFDKQVKNRSPGQVPKAAATASERGGGAALEKSEGKQRAAAADEQGSGEGGKTLPPELAALPLAALPPTAQADAPPAISPMEALIDRLAGDNEEEGEPVMALLPGMQPLPSGVQAGDGGDAESLLLDSEEGRSPLRLRDTMLQRLFPGADGKGAEAMPAKAGKPDFEQLLTPLMQAPRLPTADAGGATNPIIAQAATAAPPSSSSPVPVAMSLAVPMQQQGWDQAMGERVVWMARSNIQEAQIQLNPRELGPIEIKVSLKQDQAHVHFVAHHATTREALEAAMPRLREMLSESGLNLAQSDVSEHSFRERGEKPGSQGGGDGGGPLSLEEGADEESVVSHVAQVTARGVDYFA